MSGYEAYRLSPWLFDRGIKPLLHGADQVHSSRARRLAQIEALESQRPWGDDQIG